MRAQLSICTFLPSELLTQSLQHLLSGDRYVLTQFQAKEAFLNFIDRCQQQVDCLVLQDVGELLSIVDRLHSLGTLLPSVILKPDAEEVKFCETSPRATPTTILAEPPRPDTLGFYDVSAVRIAISQMDKITDSIDRAIAKFLEVSPAAPFCEISSNDGTIAKIANLNLLLQQQQRLAVKLKERLGYMGVYYKRNPKYFYRNLSSEEKQEFIHSFKTEYRQVVLGYFSEKSSTNQKIDEFVNTAFFADIPVTYIVEIHMELMDELSKHLKLEGRSDEVLLDYRLTLIDTIAHLCEMYRRSLPKES